jgi:hypothetical protein
MNTSAVSRLSPTNAMNTRSVNAVRSPSAWCRSRDGPADGTAGGRATSRTFVSTISAVSSVVAASPANSST